MAQAPRDDPGHSVQGICKTLGISRTTFYRYTQGGNARDTGDQGDAAKTWSPR